MKRRTSTNRQSRSRQDIARLEDIPNIGPAIAGKLRQLGIMQPVDLLGRDPYAMYDDLCRITGQRHDPCLLDTFIAAVREAIDEIGKLVGDWLKSSGGKTRQKQPLLEGVGDLLPTYGGDGLLTLADFRGFKKLD